jgi:HEAT repeat protein
MSPIQSRIALQLITSLALSVFTSYAQTTERLCEVRVPRLLKELNSSDPNMVLDSAKCLSHLSPRIKVDLPSYASAVMEGLNTALRVHDRSDVPQAAAQSLAAVIPSLRGHIMDSVREATLDALTKDLSADNSEGVRDAAIQALTKLSGVTGTHLKGEQRKPIVDDLIVILESGNGRIQSSAANALGSIFRNAQASLTTTPAEEVKEYTAEVSEAVSSLLATLRGNSDPKEKIDIVKALGSIKYSAQQVSSALVDNLKSNPDDGVRIACASVLSEFPSEAQGTGSVLASALLSSNGDLQIAAAYSLAFLRGRAAHSNDVIPNLGLVLQEQDNPELQRNAAWALGQMGPEAASQADHLVSALKSDEPSVRKNAAWGLSQIFPATFGDGSDSAQMVWLKAPHVIDELTHLINDADLSVRAVSAIALGNIANKLQHSSKYILIAPLQQAQRALHSAVFEPAGSLHDDSDSEQALRSVEDTVKTLQSGSLRQRLLGWTGNKFAIILASVVSVCLLWFAFVRLFLLRHRPLVILRWNESLRKADPYNKLPWYLDIIKIPLKLIISSYQYHDRVLDAWVAQNVTDARSNLTDRDPFKNRSVYIPLPVVWNGNTLPELTSEELHSTCKRESWRIRIIGEGGSGKTSIACRIALWAMDESPERRCSPRLMLPAVIGPSSPFNIRKDLSALKAAVRSELQSLIGSGEPVSDELIDRLLRTKRLLVILDGVSEMPQEPGTASQDWITPYDPDFPVNALIVTSRTPEFFAQGRNTDVSPMRIDSNHLLPFMNAYLAKDGQGIDDVALYDSCRRLAVMVGTDRGITPLLARLYAEQITSVAPLTDDGPKQFPRNIPELMLAYLNVLNQKPKSGDLDNPTVHLAAKITAWECLRQDFRPSRAKKSDVLTAFKAETLGRNELLHLENSLGLVKTVTPEEQDIYFVFDSVADYLAALRVIDLYRTEEKWNTLLLDCEAAPGFPDAIRGFVTALHDCCEAKQNLLEISSSVRKRLADMLSANSRTESPSTYQAAAG